MNAVDDGIWSGHLDAADLLFLIAAILFGIAGLLMVLSKPDPLKGALVPLGLMCVAIAWLIL